MPKSLDARSSTLVKAQNPFILHSFLARFGSIFECPLSSKAVGCRQLPPQTSSSPCNSRNSRNSTSRLPRLSNAAKRAASRPYALSSLHRLLTLLHRWSACHTMQWAQLGDPSQQPHPSASPQTHQGAAEWTGKHQGFLEKRSNSRFALFGARWNRRWSVRLQ